MNGRIQSWLEKVRKDSPRPLIIGIGGPGGSGKSTLSAWLASNVLGCGVLALDAFRLPRCERKPHALYGSHPDANDLLRLERCFQEFRQTGVVRQPVYDPDPGCITGETLIRDCTLLLADGEIAAYPQVRKQLDRLILVESHWRTLLNSRLTRDVCDPRSLEKTLSVYIQSNLRDYPHFSQGAREEASLIIYRNSRNEFNVRKVRDLS